MIIILNYNLGLASQILYDLFHILFVIVTKYMEKGDGKVIREKWPKKVRRREKLVREEEELGKFSREEGEKLINLKIGRWNV